MKKKNTEIRNGCFVTNIVNGLHGYVVAMQYFLTGCNRAQIENFVDNKFQIHTADETILKVNPDVVPLKSYPVSYIISNYLGMSARDEDYPETMSYKGVITCVTIYKSGTTHVAIERNNNGEVETQWFDINRIVIDKTKKMIVPVKNSKISVGGPGISPPFTR